MLYNYIYNYLLNFTNNYKKVKKGYPSGFEQTKKNELNHSPLRNAKKTKKLLSLMSPTENFSSCLKLQVEVDSDFGAPRHYLSCLLCIVAFSLVTSCISIKSSTSMFLLRNSPVLFDLKTLLLSLTFSDLFRPIKPMHHSP